MRRYNQNYYQQNQQDKDRLALRMYSRIFKSLVKGKQIIDFGAGTGYLSKHLSENYKVTAVEISKYGKKRIKELLPKLKVVNSITGLKNEDVDGIISLHVLEHVTDPRVIIKEFNRILKSKGKVMIVVPRVDGWGHKIKKDKWFAFRDKSHISLLKKEEWIEIFRNNGFKILRLSSDGFWDPPYLKIIPTFIQKLIFFPTSFLMVVFGKLIYPDYFGECLILLAEKTKSV